MRKDTYRIATLLVALSIAIVTGLYALQQRLKYGPRWILDDNTVTLWNATQDIAEMKKQLKNLDSTMKELKTNIATLPPDSQFKLDMENIHSSIQELNTRMKAIEDTVMHNPSKALTTTLMKKDLSSLESKTIHLEESLDKTNDLIFKVIVGLLTSVIVLIIGNYLPKRDK